MEEKLCLVCGCLIAEGDKVCFLCGASVGIEELCDRCGGATTEAGYVAGERLITCSKCFYTEISPSGLKGYDLAVFL